MSSHPQKCSQIHVANLVCLQPVKNPNYSCLLGPTSTYAINTAEGKHSLYINNSLQLVDGFFLTPWAKYLKTR